MTHVKTSNHKIVLMLAVLFMALACSMTGFMVSPAGANADVLKLTNSISVTATRRDDAIYNTTDTGTFQGSTYKGYAWETLKALQIRYVESGEITEAVQYNYNVKVEFRRGYISDETSFDSDDKILVDTVFSGTAETLAEIPTFVYPIDPVLKEESLSSFYTRQPKLEDIADKTAGFGWGIYKITLSINSTEAVSEYIAVRPTVADAAPQITYTLASAQEGIYDAYQFSFTNASRYSYVDQTLVKWYVKGETIDGKKIALMKDDLLLDDYAEYKDYLYEVLERSGTSFYFDSKNVQGTWDVYCVVYDMDKTTAKFTSPAETVRTGEKMSTSIIIWIIVAVGIALLGLIIFIIVKTTRKEKVW